LPFEECDIPWRRAADGELLGSGSFGSVYLALNENTGGLMAVKEVDVPVGIGHEAVYRNLQREVGLLSALKHENIVKYYGAQQERDRLYILMEYLPGGSIASMLKKFGPFRETMIRNYLTQILTGLNYLHRRSIVHRDIKGANILLTNDGRVKLSDFGQSKQLENLVLTGTSFELPTYAQTHSIEGSFQSVKGSPYWLAPESLQGGASREPQEEAKADIWSLGCVVVEMATARPPYAENDFGNLMALICHIVKDGVTPVIPTNLSPTCQALCGQCFQRDLRLRPAASDLLTGVYLGGGSKPGIAREAGVKVQGQGTFLTDFLT